jgi:hypothetical protein
VLGCRHGRRTPPFPAALARRLSAWISERQNMQKSAIEEIKELKARMESMAEQAKAEALDKAREAIGVLRELGLNNDTILKELGLKGRAVAKESREEKNTQRRAMSDMSLPNRPSS